MNTQTKRLIAVQTGLGKTYTDNNYTEVLDTDKYTLGIKYNRDKYSNLTDEEFKNIKKTPKENWFSTYIKIITTLIKTSKEQVLLLWLQSNLLETLYKEGYNIEVVLLHPDYVNQDILIERLKQRGNTESFYNRINIKEQYAKYKNDTRYTRHIVTDNLYLDDILVATGTPLANYKHSKEYINQSKAKILTTKATQTPSNMIKWNMVIILNNVFG